MKGWLVFWQFLLGVSLAVYAILVVLVAVGGFKDIRALFRSLDEQHRKGEREEGPENSSSS